MTEHYWLSSMRLTVYAAVGPDGLVTATVPITRKFVGQPLGNLMRWLESHGGFEMAEIGAGDLASREAKA